MALDDDGEHALRARLARHEDELRGLRTTVKVLVQMLSARGVLTDPQRRVLAEAAAAVTQPRPVRVHLAQVTDKYAVSGADLDCAARLPLCGGRCCSFRVVLSTQDLEEGALAWDPDDPFTLRRGLDGYCSHLDRGTGGCMVHAQRPVTCRTYDCRTDPRVWIDFEARIPAPLPAQVTAPGPLVDEP